jgi:shikimate dehydrogenase
MTSSQLDRYLVIGNPVAHSLSPQIHRAFAQQLDEPISYDKVTVELGGFTTFVREFAASGGCGLNVTLPFKLDAHAYVDVLDEHSSAAGAVNTIKFEIDGSASGFNTDGIGLLRDLTQRHSIALENKHVVLIGAGGASQGVMLPLVRAGIRRLSVMNRTFDKAQQLLAQPALRSAGVELQALKLNELDQPADLFINATSFGLSKTPIPLAAHLVHDAICYDMSYGRSARFCHWAAANGAAASMDGLGMLVEQAAQSFFIWRGREPKTEPIYAQLRALLDNTAL